MEEFQIRQCAPCNLKDILELQELILGDVENEGIVRKNSPEMLRDCLSYPHITVGAWQDGKLAAFSILYQPEGDECLGEYLKNLNLEGLKVANSKLCMVHPLHRRKALPRRLGLWLENWALGEGIDILCVTAHPENEFSNKSLVSQGYVFNNLIRKYGGLRNLYFKAISEKGKQSVVENVNLL